MSSSIREPFTVAVLTVSDSCARGEKQDLSGPAVAGAIQEKKFKLFHQLVFADEQAEI